MELLLGHIVLDGGLVEVSADLSVLLTGFVGIMWGAAAMIGILARQHFLPWTPTAPWQPLPAHHDEQAAVSFAHRAIDQGVRRDVESARGRTGGKP